MTSVRQVAFIGAGNMGEPMARCAGRAGFELIICDRNPTVLERFSKDGIKTTSNAQDCAQADAIIVLLANDQQILDVMLAPDGVIAAIPSGHSPIVCMMSTTLPDTLRQVQDALKNSGDGRVVDAPVSGGIVGAEQGTLTIMLGGEQTDIDHVRPLMESMGRQIFHCGPLGSGEVVKVLNNMLCIANMYLTAEAIELAGRNGVPFESLAPILAVSSGLNFLTADAEIGRAQYQAWAHSEDAYQAIHNIVSKDLRLALKLAKQSQLELGLLHTISQYVDSNDTQAAGRWKAAGRTH